MNDCKSEVEDRFYQGKDACSENTAKVRTQPFQDDKNRKGIGMVEFCPEPLNMLDARNKGLKFTVGKKYRCLETGNLTMTSRPLLVLNDNDEPKWIDEKYFVWSGAGLMYGKELDDFKPAEDTLWQPELRKTLWNKDVDELAAICSKAQLEVPDIRKEAEEQGVKKEFDEKKYKDSSLDELLILCGVKTQPNSPDYDEFDEVDDEPKVKAKRRVSPPNDDFINGVKNIYEGRVTDMGNDVMYNADKCLEAVDRVFGGNKRVNTDEFLSSLQNKFSKYALSWQNGFLAVDEVVTIIKQKEVNEAYMGLRALVSHKSANEKVARIVAGKLKKLF